MAAGSSSVLPRSLARDPAPLRGTPWEVPSLTMHHYSVSTQATTAFCIAQSMAAARLETPILP